MGTGTLRGGGGVEASDGVKSARSTGRFNLAVLVICLFSYRPSAQVPAGPLTPRGPAVKSLERAANFTVTFEQSRERCPPCHLGLSVS